jgi:hypothetical protein
MGVCALAGSQGGPGRLAPYRGDSERDTPWDGLRRDAAATIAWIGEALFHAAMRWKSRLSLRIFQQAVGKIPCPVHEAFDTKGIALHVK